MSKLFTLDACRHGGMTELEEAELTDGQGRALSGHKTAQAYRGYAKETMMRALAATRKRHAHLLAQKELDQQNADGAASARDEIRAPQRRRPASDRKDRLRASLNAAKGRRRPSAGDPACESKATIGSLQPADSVPALNSYFDKLSGVQPATSSIGPSTKTKPAQNFQMRGQLNFQMRSKFQIRAKQFA